MVRYAAPPKKKMPTKSLLFREGQQCHSSASGPNPVAKNEVLLLPYLTFGQCLPNELYSRGIIPGSAAVFGCSRFSGTFDCDIEPTGEHEPHHVVGFLVRCWYGGQAPRPN